MTEPQAGDWVRVLALVTDPDPHPDEYAVRLESHNEHYVGLVRRDMCEPSDPPADAPRCPSLLETESGVAGTMGSTVLRRCDKKYEHSGKHTSGGMWAWTDEQAYGSVEL